MENNFYKDFWEKKANTKFEYPLIKPVKPFNFFKYWTNSQMFPKQMIPVDKTFTKDLKRLSNINEFVIAWGKRAGKDFLISNLITYIIYFLLCQENPQNFLGIKENENIDIVNISFDEEQAKTVFFEKFKERIKRTINPKTGINFFEEMGMNLNRDIQKKEIYFPKNIRAFSLNSVRFKAEGKNIVFAIFDEIAQFRFDKADAIRRHIKTTAKATCPKFYKLFYISFLTNSNDFMANLISQAERGEIKSCFYMREATWNIRSSTGCPKDLRPYIVYRKTFQDDFDKDPDNSKLMFECKIPKVRKNSFIKQSEKILENIGYLEINGKKMFRISPLLEDKDKVFIYDDELMGLEFERWFKPFFVWEIWKLEKEYERAPGQSIENRIRLLKERHLSSDYFVGLDLSRGIVDSAGLSLGHRYYIGENVKIYIDLMLAIRARKGTEIDMSLLLDFIVKKLHYGKKQYGGLGFGIQKIIADSWNSNLFLNLCERENIDVETVSLERTTIPYNTFKDFIYNVDINYYPYSVFLREIEELIVDDKGKINHPPRSQRRMKEEGLPKGSKDVSDTVALIAYGSTEDSEEGGLSWASDSELEN